MTIFLCKCKYIIHKQDNRCVCVIYGGLRYYATRRPVFQQVEWINVRHFLFFLTAGVLRQDDSPSEPHNSTSQNKRSIITKHFLNIHSLKHTHTCIKSDTSVINCVCVSYVFPMLFPWKRNFHVVT
jgi:hypothetical protein